MAYFAKLFPNSYSVHQEGNLRCFEIVKVVNHTVVMVSPYFHSNNIQCLFKKLQCICRIINISVS